MAREECVRALFKADPTKPRQSLRDDSELRAFFERQAQVSLRLIKALVDHEQEKPNEL